MLCNARSLALQEHCGIKDRRSFIVRNLEWGSLSEPEDINLVFPVLYVNAVYLIL